MRDIPPEQSLIEYPSQFPIKVMGANVEGFAEAAGSTHFAQEVSLGHRGCCG